MRFLVMLCVLMLMMPQSGRTVDAITTLFVDGTATIKIDGELTDWDAYHLESYKLHPGHNSITDHQNDKRLSATVQCFADKNYIYVSYNVKDDSLLFGEEMLGHPFWDDSVLTIFPREKDNVPRLIIYTTADEQGNTFIEFHDKSNVFYPYLLEELGVVSFLKQTDDGYVVELAIPHDVMDISYTQDGLQTEMNFTVIDDDDGEDYEETLMLEGVFWGISELLYVPFHFRNGSEKLNIVEENSQNLSDLSSSSDKDIITEILCEIWVGNYELAEQRLQTCADAPWVKPMLAAVLTRSGKLDDAIGFLEDIAENYGDRKVVLWASQKLNTIYRNHLEDYEKAERIAQELLNDSNWFCEGFAVMDLEMCERQQTGYRIPKDIFEEIARAKNLNPIIIKDIGMQTGDVSVFMNSTQDDYILDYFHFALSQTSDNKPWIKYDIHMLLKHMYLLKNNKPKALESLKEIIRTKPNNLRILAQIAEDLEEAGGYEEAFDIYADMQESGSNDTMKDNGKIGMARIYYKIGFYQHAKQIANELITATDLEIASKAQMLLYMVDEGL